ncbi:MAG: hypothetical protein EZS26_002775 [Candidatus Ordinivivax streblomastigis]|uniref:Uncharacterized protein n=1 Tax=Candidatus Ordinivivax streblomastigis TaxID=2540710 RepID=A0A5M8NYP7_9BACT|nr:MAG: hypothetical protein EZS26_002775 [Candidatus Ordinivivax streblomastigis]
MDKFSDFLPIIVVIIVIISSIRKTFKQTASSDSEMTKTTLPGRRSGQEIHIPETVHPIPTETIQSIKQKNKKTASKLVHESTGASLRQITPPLETEDINDEGELIFNINDAEDIKKAVLYSEILNRKHY